MIRWSKSHAISTRTPTLPSNTAPLSPLISRDQKRQFQRLFLIQARITKRLIPASQVFVLQTLRATCAFRDRIACQLEMYAAEEGTAFCVNAQGFR